MSSWAISEPDTDPRLKEILKSLVTHLHDFARETNLTHAEWRKGIEFLEWAGQHLRCRAPRICPPVRCAGPVVAGRHAAFQPEGTSSSVLGPFHITGAPPLARSAVTCARIYGEQVLLAEGTIRDTDGNPIEGAELDIWQTAPNGMYSSQDPDQDTYSFHGIQTTGKDGRYAFTTVKPVCYTVPSDGPVGDILNASGRHPWRPSHLHYIVKAPGFRTLVTEIFPDDDPYLGPGHGLRRARRSGHDLCRRAGGDLPRAGRFRALRPGGGAVAKGGLRSGAGQGMRGGAGHLNLKFVSFISKLRTNFRFKRVTSKTMFLGSGPINLNEMVGMNLLGYEAQSCRKPSGFQRFATTLPGKFTLSRRDAKTALICCVKPLNRARSPLFALFLAARCRLLRHFDQINES